MVKRPREHIVEDACPPSKRTRTCRVDPLSRLSDELILRVLSQLPASDLVTCERLSRNYQRLAKDSQLWRALYYCRFVRPRLARASRASGAGDDGKDCREWPSAAAKASRWLEDEHLVKCGPKTNWKQQYKLRNNWARGACAFDEISVAEQASVPPILVQMHAGIVYMVDQDQGLRAWSAGDRKMVANLTLDNLFKVGHLPTSLIVDSSSGGLDVPRLLIGHEDGSFALYRLAQKEATFVLEHACQTSSNGIISAVALSWPYAVTMSATQSLSVYRFRQDHEGIAKPPILLHSLRSPTVWPPLATHLRCLGTNLCVSVAYALPTYLQGWTVGLQEIIFSETGDLVDSRVASAISQHYRPLALTAPPMVRHLTPLPASASLTLELRSIHSKPISLSYTHPYLLVSHPDNTLTLYVVTSTDKTLTISSGSRLFGHTSSVSGAHVGGRGQAVSVSKRGDELRVWQLEGGFGSSAAKARLATCDLSVRVQPSRPQPSKKSAPSQDLSAVGEALTVRAAGRSCASEASDMTLTRGWVGFDEEKIVILKEHGHGRQALELYDFT